MIRWREGLVIVALFGILIGFTVYGPGRSQTDQEGKAGSTHSLGDDGALALQRWLGSLGYDAANLEYTEWRVPDQAQALWIINAYQEPMRDADAQEILRWVRAGGTLIAIDDRPQQVLSPNGLWRLLGVTTTISDTKGTIAVERAATVQPLLASPPVTSVPVQTSGAIALKDPGYVILLQTHFGPTLIGRQEGRGYIYLGVSAHPFTNQGLREAGSGGLVLNLVAHLPRGAMILFDEYHHGFGQGAATAPSLRRIALSQWWGWAGIYAIGICTLYLVLTGRRFGRPIPLAQDIARRSSGEYVQSIAHLHRRGHKQASVAQHFHDGVKRRLARPYGFIPPADDNAFVRELQRMDGITDDQARVVRQLLADLSRPKLAETELMRFVGQADTIIDERGRLR
jgi:hypothetical protein